jgi:hypothetical protein
VISDRQILAKQRAQAAGNPVYWQVRQTKADGRECLQRVGCAPSSEAVGDSIRVRRCAPLEPGGGARQFCWRSDFELVFDLGLEPAAMSSLPSSSIRSVFGAARPDRTVGRGWDLSDCSCGVLPAAIRSLWAGVDASDPSGSARVSMCRWGTGFGRRSGRSGNQTPLSARGLNRSFAVLKRLPGSGRSVVPIS